LSLPVQIGGRGKNYPSLDKLEAAIRRSGGPDKMRAKLLAQGFGHVKVNDEEFGGVSYIGLSPEHFVVNPVPLN
jgi:hypothetical protein